MKYSIFALILLTFSSFAHADLSLEGGYTQDDDVVVAFGGWSTHLISEVTNETHDILAAEYNGWSGGYFKNSFGRDSFFVSKNWRWKIPEIPYTEFLVSLGVNRGYTTCYGEDYSGKNVCMHFVWGFTFTKWALRPSVKILGDAIVFNPEIKF